MRREQRRCKTANKVDVFGSFRNLSVRLLAVSCSLFLCLPAFLSLPARAQTLFGSLVGTVTDAGGAAVPDATVKITNLQTNDQRTVQTDNGGVYTVSTIPQGTYGVNVSKAGFHDSETTGVVVNANNTVRVNATLQVGAVSQTVEVQSGSAAQLQTDTADVRSEIPSQTLETVPQPTRTYEGILNLVPGVSPPGGQLTGGTNNPSKSMQFAANGSGTSAPNVRIEGVSAAAPWSVANTTFVPSVEAIANVNVVTNSPDAEQGLSGGPSVTVTLKSGSNGVHGAFYEYNINNATEARNFFQPVGQGAPHLVDNDTGGWISGPIIPNKLFYYAGYEGDYLRQGLNGIIAVPTPTMLSGDESGSPTPIYDPATGNADGTGRTPFPGNIIPQSRISPIVQKLIPDFPKPNLPGIVNNLNTNQGQTYNLHKIDTKIDYQATQKLRISGRYGYQPYNSLTQPLYGPILGGASDGWAAFAAAQAGNYQQYGATLAVSASATYVLSPTWVIDATFGVTQAHQLLFPTQSNVKYGADVLGIPGTNVGTLPFAGGLPQFTIGNGTDYGGPTFGYSYPPLEYKDPIFEYAANATKVLKSHNIRFGEDIRRIHINHREIPGDAFFFTGGLTSLNASGAPAPGDYNFVSDFLLGLPQNTNASYQSSLVTIREWDFGLYVRDQWQVSHKWTLNYGVRWEHYPVPTSVTNSFAYNNLQSNANNPTLSICGVNGVPGNCGISVSSKLFAPSIGIAFRPTETTVIRAGYAVSPIQYSMGHPVVLNYPSIVEGVYNGTNSFALSNSGTLAQGLPTIATPNLAPGIVPIPFGVGNVNTDAKNYVRGYVQSDNVTLQQDLSHGFIWELGYVGTHVVNNSALGAVNINYGQVGGGSKSQPFSQYGITGKVSVYGPEHNSYDLYNALQTSIQKRLANGLSMQAAYTWSKDIQGGPLSTGILIPQYQYLNRSLTPADRTQNFILTSTYQLPFGSNKMWVNHGIGGAILGGWSVNGIFSHVSGTPFSVGSSGASCNCPGNTQRANQVKAHVAKGSVPHTAQDGSSWFDPTAFAPVTTASFGTASYYSLRGPGATNLDASVFRNFQIWERLQMQFRAESFNVTNTPHFGNPGASVSSAAFKNGVITSLNGYSQIASLNPLGRLIDPRYFRFGVRFTF
jgi:Carboxypeptidase regulatory-like domain/TonB dependent receptor